MISVMFFVSVEKEWSHGLMKLEPLNWQMTPRRKVDN